jgi:putative transposase
LIRPTRANAGRSENISVALDGVRLLGRCGHRGFNVTDHPTAEWVVQQLRDAFLEAGPYRYAIFDRYSTFNEEVVTFLEATGLKPKRTSVQAPWQNGVAERWIGSARRDCFDHVIALNEAHVRRLGREFIAYYHEDRTHLGLGKDTPIEKTD